MVHIAEMTRLKSLNLDNVGYPGEDVALTDEGVKKLATLTNLEFLHLGKTQVGDAGLASLAPLKKLNHIELTHCTKVTPAGIEAVKAAFPGIEIVR